MTDPNKPLLLSSSSDDEPQCNLVDFDLSYVDEDFNDPVNDKDLIAESASYILGTLVVRVAAARDLQAMNAGGLGNFFGGASPPATPSTHHKPRRKLLGKGSSNPYAFIRLGSQSQRTSVVAETLDPTWPREEQYYMDVSLPVTHLVHSHPTATTTTATPMGLDILHSLHISIHHALHYKAEYDTQCKKLSDSNYPTKPCVDPLLGYAIIPISSLLHGKTTHIDEWVPLQLSDPNMESQGQVRVICEYEPTDTPPRPGDFCRFTSLVHPRHVYPIPISTLFRVDSVQDDDLYLSYRTPIENWLSTCKVHRFMILCEHRHTTAVERYQEELLAVAEKLIHSPMISGWKDTVDRLPEDGVLSLGMETVVQGMGVLGRWYSQGFSTAVEDVIHVTNWDGRFNPRGGEDNPSEMEDLEVEEDPDLDLSYSEEEEDRGDGLKMPPCPITGLPMRHPVVAADGHTYEKSAISRWLKDNDTSPMTGTVMSHKNLVPNYLLISTFQASSV